MNRKLLPVDELLRLACIYAEDNAREHLRCIAGTDEEEEAKTLAFIEQLHAYRMKRWGKTKLDAVREECKPVPVEEIAKRPDSVFGAKAKR